MNIFFFFFWGGGGGGSFLCILRSFLKIHGEYFKIKICYWVCLVFLSLSFGKH